MAKLPRAWNFHIDFVGRMNPVLTLSALLCVASIALVVFRGLNYGTDFAGGLEIQARLPAATSESQVRAQLAPLGLADARVQRFGAEADNTYLIMVRGDFGALPPQKVQALQAQVAALGGDTPPGFTLADNGETLTLEFARAVDVSALTKAVEAAGVEVKKVQSGGRPERPRFTVELKGLSDKVGQALGGAASDGAGGAASDGAGGAVIERIDFVGPQVGSQLRTQGLMAVVYSLFFILIYVAVRFDMLFSPGAIIATLHDVIITVGVLALFRIEFSLNVVAALLTLIGFSLNDTIVVYDRIRESIARRPTADLEGLVNQAINDTLSRTILTSGTVLLVTAALLALGGPFIFGLSITMFVGVVVGTYSSIAVASPLYILLRRRFGAAPGDSRKRNGAPKAQLRMSSPARSRS